MSVFTIPTAYGTAASVSVTVMCMFVIPDIFFAICLFMKKKKIFFLSRLHSHARSFPLQNNPVLYCVFDK